MVHLPVLLCISHYFGLLCLFSWFQEYLLLACPLSWSEIVNVCFPLEVDCLDSLAMWEIERVATCLDWHGADSEST